MIIKPLSGTRVLDLTIYLAGPYCTQILAGLGAEVIKVERPLTGDPARQTPPFAGSRGVSGKKQTPQDLSFSILKRCRNKKSMTLDLSTPDGKNIFREMVKKSNVVVENFRPGVMQRQELDYEQLKKVNPAVIYCAMSGFGQTGKYKDLPAFDLIAQGFSGLMSCTGLPDQQPTRSALAVGDLSAALYGAIGILAAVRHQDRTGQGQMIDISMLDCLVSLLLDEPFDFYLQQGIPVRAGNRITRLTPFNTYRTKDGYVSICAPSDENWQAMLRLMKREDLLGNERYDNTHKRVANYQEVEDIIESWTMQLHTDEVAGPLQRAGIPAAHVRDIQEVYADEELQARGMIGDIIHQLGAVKGYRSAASPVRLSETPVELRDPAPYLGQHNSDILQRLLGYSLEQIKVLEANKII